MKKKFKNREKKLQPNFSKDEIITKNDKYRNLKY